MKSYPCLRIDNLNDLENDLKKVINSNRKMASCLKGSKYESKLKNGIDVCLSKDNLIKTSFEDIKKVIDKVNSLKLKIYFSIDNSMLNQSNKDRVNYLYSKSELNKLIDIDNYLKKTNNYPLRINESHPVVEPIIDYEYSWTLDKVLNANSKIDKIVYFIKKSKLSNFETMLFIHHYVSNYVYNEKEDNDDQKGRVLPSVINDKYIVCSGYASLVKAIIDKLDNKDLKAELLGLQLNDNNGYSGHCINLIKIKDDKYDIEGIYLDDSTFDSKIDYSRGFSNCLYPVSDLNHLLNKKVTSKLSDSRLFNLLYANDCNYQKNDIFNKYKYKGKAIELDKYKNALIEVFKAKYGNIDKAIHYMESEIRKSIRNSIKIFNKDSKNTFISEYKQTHKIR